MTSRRGQVAAGRGADEIRRSFFTYISDVDRVPDQVLDEISEQPNKEAICGEIQLNEAISTRNVGISSGNRGIYKMPCSRRGGKDALHQTGRKASLKFHIKFQRCLDDALCHLVRHLGVYTENIRDACYHVNRQRSRFT